MIIDLSQLSANAVYHTMLQTIIPRPIAWVLTDNGIVNGYANGDLNKYNLAPFSYFAPVSSDPAILMISIGKKPDGSDKDTLVNIRENKFFVVHIASSDLAETVTASSATLAHGDSEVRLLDLTLMDFNDFTLPRLACCKIAYACELLEIKEIGNVPQQIVFGIAKQIYIADELVQEQGGRQVISANKIDPLGRIGGDEYWVGGEVKTVKRPK